MTGQPMVMVPHQQKEADTIRTELELNIPDINLNVATSPDESLTKIETADILIATKPLPEQLDRQERLKWIVTGSSGYDHLDLNRLRDQDIMLTNASGLSKEPMAETVLGYMLLFERRLLQGIHNKHAGVNYQNYTGMGLLTDRTVGIVGVGENGGRVAELCSALGMTVIGTKRTPETANEAVDEIYDPDGLYEVLSRADYLVLSCSLNDSTHGLIGLEELQVVKNSAVLINISRPAVVDEDDLVTALQLNMLDGVATDQVAEESRADSTLWQFPNVVITPSTAGQFPSKTYFYEHRVCPMFIDNYEKFVAGEEDAMENRVL